MTTAASPFELSATMPPELVRARDYWESLKRGDASMPFWDDVTLSSLPDLAGCLMLLDVFILSDFLNSPGCSRDKSARTYVKMAQNFNGMGTPVAASGYSASIRVH